MKKTGVVGVVTLSLVTVFAFVATSPAQAYTLYCSGKTAAEVAACDTSDFATRMNKSYWGAYSGHNCTNYAAYRMSIAGVPTPKIRMGNGNEWAANARTLGYVVNKTPAVGAIAAWALPNNHVGYVEEVGSNYIVVSDSSYSAKVFKRYRVDKTDKWYPNEFIHFLGGIKPTPTPTPTPSPTATPTAKPSPTPTTTVKKPASSNVVVTAPKSIKKTKKPAVKVWIKSGNARVATGGTLEVYRGKTKIKTVTYSKSAKGYVTFSLPKQKKGKHTFTFVSKASKDYKKSSKKVTIKFT